ATIEGARCLGLSDATGSLAPGKRADIVAVDLRRAHLTPLMHGRWSNIAAHLVFSASRSDVESVWVDGLRVVDRGRLVTGDLDSIRADAQLAAEELFARRDALGRP
ncbi:MAG: 5-methylthioadenosine/S-adenosylhomocysteine deaminase, partial [Frankiaceae bacterium]|nr:5-methylthioadenosine/S-adenosylhomocysteine deaminase [Frankiaceae bacterium]